MNNFSHPSDKNSFDPEFPISPLNALALVAASILLIGFFGLTVRSVLENMFGKIDWNSPFLILELLIIVPAVLVVRRHKLSFKTSFRFNHISPVIIFLSVILGVSIAVIGDQLDRIVQNWYPLPEMFEQATENIFLTSNHIDFWLILLIATFGAGICEEMLFRGFLQRIFEKKFHIVPALVIPTILFGLIHLLPWLFVQIMVMGLVLGLIAWRTNSIYPTIIVHSLNNLIGSLYMRFHTSELDAFYLKNDFVNPAIVLIAIALFVFAGKLMWKLTGQNQADEWMKT